MTTAEIKSKTAILDMELAHVGHVSDSVCVLIKTFLWELYLSYHPWRRGGLGVAVKKK